MKTLCKKLVPALVIMFCAVSLQGCAFVGIIMQAIAGVAGSAAGGAIAEGIGGAAGSQAGAIVGGVVKSAVAEQATRTLSRDSEPGNAPAETGNPESRTSAAASDGSGALAVSEKSTENTVVSGGDEE